MGRNSPLASVVESQNLILSHAQESARARGVQIVALSVNAIHEYALFPRSSTRREPVPLGASQFILRDAFSAVLNGAMEAHLAGRGVPFLDVYWAQRAWLKLPGIRGERENVAMDSDVRHHAVFMTLLAVEAVLENAARLGSGAQLSGRRGKPSSEARPRRS